MNESHRWEPALRKIAVVATVGMFLVLMMGATVTNTGSAEGCGDHWPLCHGEFIPRYTIETAIEYSHRMVTGIEGILIMVTAVGALKLRPGRRDVRLLVGLMVGSLFLQAGMGAWAVKESQYDAVLALHFGFALICFASTYLVMMAIREAGAATPIARPAPPPRFGPLAWGALVAVYGVAYLGAYVRHSSAELACGTDWPLCNGGLVSTERGAEGAHFGHRLAAFGSVLLILGLVAWAARFKERRPDIYQSARVAAGLILAQSIIGGIIVVTELSIFATLAHAGVMGLLFVVLCDVARRTLAWHVAPGEVRSGVTRSAPLPAGD
jgi:cytochrome c oxidase assembly protein subunit 15